MNAAAQWVVVMTDQGDDAIMEVFVGFVSEEGAEAWASYAADGCKKAKITTRQFHITKTSDPKLVKWR